MDAMRLVARFKKIPRSRAVIAAGALAVGIAVGGAGIAFSAIPDPSGLVYGCVSNLTGVLRVIDPSTGATCTAVETALNFNQQGPQGLIGPRGTVGPQGPAATKLYARLDSAGTLQYGSGVTAVSHPQAGIYHVTFAQDVTTCAISANVESDGATPNGPYAAILVVFNGTANTGLPGNTVEVIATNVIKYPGSQVNQDTPMSVVANC